MSLSDKFLFSFVSWSMKLRQFDVQLFSPKLLSLLLLQCFVEKCNVKAVYPHLLKSQGCSDLSQGIFMCRHQVVLQPQLCSSVAMCYAPPNKHFKITWKCFHIQSPTESIADKLSFFLILRPTPLRQKITVTVCCSLPCQGGDVNQNSIAFFSVGTALICLSL